MEILGRRPDTPSVDEQTTQQEINDLEEDARKKDSILENWFTPPGSPWERSEDTTYDTSSLSWDTEEITFGMPPTSWDEEEEKPTDNKTSTGNSETDDSLPELVSDDTEEEEDGFTILNTLVEREPRAIRETSLEAMQQDGSNEEQKTDKERAQRNQKIIEEIDRRDEKALMEELAIEEILDLEDGISRKPIPAIMCPLTGEQIT